MIEFVFLFVLSPAVLIVLICAVKDTIVDKHRIKELKFLRKSGVEHAVITKDYIKF